ncbi:MAG TPA: sigma-54-dependent Fis family transcriptional regulator [Bacteroidales bacterium]|nr:sigma-54-dependent Fis family transcriptional regulator [Bacteroidales bacterium]
MSKYKGKILVVDDDIDVLTTARMVLKQRFSDVEVETNPQKIPDHFKKSDIDVVILDMNFRPGVTSGEEGIFWLKKILDIDPDASIVMNTAYGDIQIAVEAMKIGASEFIVKPWTSEKFLVTVETVYKLSKSKKQVNKLQQTQQVLNQELNKDYSEIISESNAMQPVFSAIDKVSGTEANVLILGENGTGKELVAREIHRKSKRSGNSFINVDLGAISQTLFESELFGHAKGAFTDAKEDKPGRFEIASDGTLFLDEIGNLSLNLQSKLLSVIQNKSVTRVGSNKNIDINIRLICATNKDLYKMVDQGEFREDLLYRINTVEINLPPLKNRKKDILVLASRFLKTFSDKYNKQGLKLSSKAEQALLDYNFPGNIRELQHIVERAVIMAEGKIITENDLSIKKSTTYRSDSLNVEDLEKQAIQGAIQKHNGNFTKASEELGLGRSTLYRKMKKYGI